MNKKFLLLFLLAVCLIKTAVAQEVTPIPRAYTIGPGDEITMKVLGEKDFDAVATVDENGNLELPFFDKPIPAMCKTERELRADVSDMLKKYLRAPQVGLSVSARKSRPPVTVSGEVKTQQQVVLTRKTRLWELITFSGGVTDDAGGMIEVFRTQQPICADPQEIVAWKAEADANRDFGGSARMYSISTVQQGRDEANPIIYPGDIINVQKGKPVYVVGEVKGGQGLLLKEGGLPLTRAIAMVGGVSREARTKDVKIYRMKPNTTEKEVISANLDLIKQNQQPDVMLQPYDIIEVNKAKKSIAQTILELAAGTGRSAVGGFGTVLPQRVLY